MRMMDGMIQKEMERQVGNLTHLKTVLEEA